jgi:HEAT repeat protein
MNINELIENLSIDSRTNESLKLLTDIVVDTPDELIDELIKLISSPHKISDTNAFASLISDLPSERYTAPLVKEISRSVVGETPWLADYLYALANILDELEDRYVPEDSFVDLLGEWLLNTGSGEISWKSAILLAQLKHPNCLSYYEQGAKLQGLFFLSRIECLKRLVNECGREHMKLFQELLNDPQEEIREAAKDALNWLNQEDHEV